MSLLLLPIMHHRQQRPWISNSRFLNRIVQRTQHRFSTHCQPSNHKSLTVQASRCKSHDPPWASTNRRWATSWCNNNNKRQHNQSRWRKKRLLQLKDKTRCKEAPQAPRVVSWPHRPQLAPWIAQRANPNTIIACTKISQSCLLKASQTRSVESLFSNRIRTSKAIKHLLSLRQQQMIQTRPRRKPLRTLHQLRQSSVNYRLWSTKTIMFYLKEGAQLANVFKPSNFCKAPHIGPKLPNQRRRNSHQLRSSLGWPSGRSQGRDLHDHLQRLPQPRSTIIIVTQQQQPVVVLLREELAMEMVECYPRRRQWCLQRMLVLLY